MDELKRKAGEQSVLLAEKQAEADTALREITVSMQVSDYVFEISNSCILCACNVKVLEQDPS